MEAANSVTAQPSTATARANSDQQTLTADVDTSTEAASALPIVPGPADRPPSINLDDEVETMTDGGDQLNTIITMLSSDYLTAATQSFNDAITSAMTPPAPLPLFSSSSSTSNVPTSKGKTIHFYLAYLSELREPEHIVEDEGAIVALLEIGELFKKDKESIGAITECKLQLILKNLFDYFYTQISEYTARGVYDIAMENNSPLFNTFHIAIDLTETLVVGSKEFDSYFYMIGGIRCLLAYFSNRQLVNYFVKCCAPSDPHRHERKANYCESLASLLNILLYLKFNRVHGFKKLNVVEVLTEFANSLAFENFDLVLRAHFILANLCTRKQIESLKYHDLTLIILERTIQLFAQACQKNTKYTFFEYDLYYDGRMITFEINLKNSPNSFIMIILFCMQAFLVRDDVKYRTFYTIKNSLIILAMLGDYDEKFLALSLLFYFSHDEVLSEKLTESTSLLVQLEQSLLQLDQLDESIYILTVCLRNMLNKKHMLTGYKNRAKTIVNVPATTSKQRIVLTYHDSNELVCMRIKLELEKRGLSDTHLIKRAKLKPDTGNPNNQNNCSSTTTVTASAAAASTKSKVDIDNVIAQIEQCDQLIVCMSSLFEFSEICQFEVFYARALGKKIVPVVIQNEYVPDYWLDELCEEHGKPVIKIGLNTIKTDILKVIDEVRVEPRAGHDSVTAQQQHQPPSVIAKAAASYGPKNQSTPSDSSK